VYVFYNSTVPAASLSPWPRFADINRDGMVDGTDLAQIITTFGACPPGMACDGDVDHSGAVDSTDLIRVMTEMN
jgi:Ca2+-binding EF-hand superfamily protein